MKTGRSAKAVLLLIFSVFVVVVFLTSTDKAAMPAQLQLLTEIDVKEMESVPNIDQYQIESVDVVSEKLTGKSAGWGSQGFWRGAPEKKIDQIIAGL
ncbi:MAG: hypothetical protein JJU37_00045 [Balneolaceae bacterium]|nr:hypothetical protein [Balneolaceae bacterium]